MSYDANNLRRAAVLVSWPALWRRHMSRPSCVGSLCAQSKKMMLAHGGR